jgi:hypothetical protein
LIENQSNNNDNNDQRIQSKKRKTKVRSPHSCLFGPLGHLLRKVVNGVDECVENIKNENDGNNAKNINHITNQSDNIVYRNRDEHGKRGKSVNLSRAETFLQFHGVAVELTDFDEKQCKKAYLASKLYHFYPIWHIGRGLCIIIGEGVVKTCV